MQETTVKGEYESVTSQCTRMHVCTLYIFYTLLWCMYAYMLHSTQINIRIHIYIYTYIYIYILFLCTYIYTQIYICIHIYVYMHTCCIRRRKHTELPCITPHSCIHLYICDISEFFSLYKCNALNLLLDTCRGVWPITACINPIAFGLSFNLNLQSRFPWSFFRETWPTRARKLKHRLRFEIDKMTLQMQ